MKTNRRTFLQSLLAVTALPVVAKIPAEPVGLKFKGDLYQFGESTVELYDLTSNESWFLNQAIEDTRAKPPIGLNDVEDEYIYRFVNYDAVDRFKDGGWEVVGTSSTTYSLMRY